jgi:hypothetical protein
VLDDDLREPVSGPSGAGVVTVRIGEYLAAPLNDLTERLRTRDLGSIGQRTCLPTLAGGREQDIRRILRRAGWRRLVEKQLRYSQAFQSLPPGEVLYRGLLDGLGLTRNRDGMAAVAERIALATLEVVASSAGAATAALLGAAGFLPLSPADAALAELAPVESVALERMFSAITRAYGIAPLPPATWQLNRVRPLNHPVRRLASLGALVERCHERGLLDAFLALELDGGRSWSAWLDGLRPAIGRARADQLAINVLAPFAAAYASATDDVHMAQAVSETWERLPGAADDAIARGTLRQIVGDARFPIALALESQGLHQIGRGGCQALRCFECPIALLALEHEPTHFPAAG